MPRLTLTLDRHYDLAGLSRIAHGVMAGRIAGGRVVPSGERVPLSQADVAARLGVAQPQVSRALAYDYDGEGPLSLWRVSLLLRIIGEVGGLDVDPRGPLWHIQPPRPRHSRGNGPRGNGGHEGEASGEE